LRTRVGRLRRRPLAVVGATVLGLAALGVAGATAFVALGLYDTSVTAQHTQPVYSLLEVALARSAKRHARQVAVPPLGDAAQLERGAACYRDHCLQCHGGPGVAQQPIGLSMQPLPGPLVDAAARWQAREIYWITREGIKMSGMPAWRYRLADADLWAVVAFVQQLPALGPQAFKASVESPPSCTDSAPAAHAAPDPERGRIALQQHACTACHVIPGLTGSDVHVGPPLAGIGRRKLIAGAVPNTPDQLVRWIREPHAVDPGTAMPTLKVSEGAARDMAAYLATLQ
jgi:mono/diheme cytochrome c family protein